jgi:hypothetical protein
MERIPPFQPGDRVVRIGGSVPYGGPIKDQVYTVTGINWCCEGIGWRIEIAEVSFSMWIAMLFTKGFMWNGCTKCKKKTSSGWAASDFRKVNDVSDHTIESLLEELAPAIEEPILI